MDAHIKKVYVPMTETGFYILLCLRSPNHGYGVVQKVREMTDNEVVLGPGTMYGSLSKILKIHCPVINRLMLLVMKHRMTATIQIKRLPGTPGATSDMSSATTTVYINQYILTSFLEKAKSFSS